jgi:hypothetical protein
MMEDYGIHHRINSVANTRTNARAELGDKTVKRMVMDIVSATGYWTEPWCSASVEKQSRQRRQAVSSHGSLSERAQRLVAKAGVCPDGGHVDEPGGCRAKHTEKIWYEHTRAMESLNLQTS